MARKFHSKLCQISRISSSRKLSISVDILTTQQQSLIAHNYDKNGISSTAWVKRGKNPDSLVFEYDIKPPNSFNMAAARLYSAEEPKTMSFFLVDERPWGSPDSCAQRFTSESGEITDVNIPFTAISQNEYSKTLDALYRDASK